MNRPSILIISNKIDFTVDYVCVELEKSETEYLRINREDFHSYKIQFDILNCILTIEIERITYSFSPESLESVWYRAPIYLRDIYQPGISVEDQLFRTQWTAFIRNLTVFETVYWMNNPESTFRAENKMLQLRIAKKIGFTCPVTTICNSEPQYLDANSNYIVKPIDTAVLRIDEKEAFVYANVVSGDEIKDSYLGLVPVVLQEFVCPKTDIRVTVINETVFAVTIQSPDGNAILGDWRKEKPNARFEPVELPKVISSLCIQMLKSLNLAFGAFDFALRDKEYFFLEVNPTGEWAWLVDAVGYPIPKTIANALQRNPHVN